MKKNQVIFPLLVFFSLAFVTTSVFLVTKVRDLQNQIEKNVDLISHASSIEEQAYTLLSDFDFYATNATNDAAKRIVDQSLEETVEYKLDPLVRKLKKLRANAEVNISGNKTKTIQELLFGVEGFCKKLIREKRIQTGKTSAALSNYWKFTYYLIGAACLLALLLAYTGYYIFSAKTKIDSLTNMKSLLLNKSIDVVVTCDEQGCITEFNDAAEKAFGYSNNEVLGKAVSFLYSDMDQAKTIREAINLDDFYHGEIKNRKKNGEIFVSQLSANVLRDENGKRIGSMGVSRDITKQKELETNFEMIVNNVADIVYTCNLQGEFTFVNRAVIDVLGFKSEELLGKPFTTIIKKEDIPRVAEKYMKQFTTGQAVSYDEFMVTRKDGTTVKIGQSVRLVMSQTHKDRIVGAHGIARNLDAIKKEKTV